MCAVPHKGDNLRLTDYLCMFFVDDDVKFRPQERKES
jgi:hypothetical protein